MENYRRGGLPYKAIRDLRTYRANLEDALAGRWDGETLSTEDLKIAKRNERELVKVEAALDILEA
jgi:hypothetical protein